MDSAFFEGFFGGPQVQKQAEALSPRSPRSSPRSPALSARVGVSQAADGRMGLQTINDGHFWGVNIL